MITIKTFSFLCFYAIASALHSYFSPCPDVFLCVLLLCFKLMHWHKHIMVAR